MKQVWPGPAGLRLTARSSHSSWPGCLLIEHGFLSFKIACRRWADFGDRRGAFRQLWIVQADIDISFQPADASPFGDTCVKNGPSRVVENSAPHLLDHDLLVSISSDEASLDSAWIMHEFAHVWFLKF